MIVGILLSGFVFTIILIFAKKHEQDEQFSDLEKTVVVENLISWSHVRSGARQAITATEKQVAAMDDRTFERAVAENLERVNMQAEAAEVRRKGYMVKPSSDLLAEWDVRYKALK